MEQVHIERKRRRQNYAITFGKNDSSGEKKKNTKCERAPNATFVPVTTRYVKTVTANKSIVPHTSKCIIEMSSATKFLPWSELGLPLPNVVSKVYLMWQNDSNLCWLHSSLAILVHNCTVQHAVIKIGRSELVNIIKLFNEAMIILNDMNSDRRINVRVQKAREKLKFIQESSLTYLQPIMKFEGGKPDSAFCCIYSLIIEEENIKKLFDVEYALLRKCTKCKANRVLEYKKPIITLSKVDNFHPDLPVSICQCPVCKETNQMVLTYKSLPACLMFHFENGAGYGNLKCLEFTINSRKYHVTGIITWSKPANSNVKHFVTWIRDPTTDNWLECDDLDTNILAFSVMQPDIKLEDIYIIQSEASDMLGTIPNKTEYIATSTKCSNEGEHSYSNAEIPLIDLCEETSNLKPVHKTYGNNTSTLSNSMALCSNEAICREGHCNENGNPGPLKLNKSLEVPKLPMKETILERQSPVQNTGYRAYRISRVQKVLTLCEILQQISEVNQKIMKYIEIIQFVIDNETLDSDSHQNKCIPNDVKSVGWSVYLQQQLDKHKTSDFLNECNKELVNGNSESMNANEKESTHSEIECKLAILRKLKNHASEIKIIRDMVIEKYHRLVILKQKEMIDRSYLKNLKIASLLSDMTNGKKRKAEEVEGNGEKVTTVTKEEDNKSHQLGNEFCSESEQGGFSSKACMNEFNSQSLLTTDTNEKQTSNEKKCAKSSTLSSGEEWLEKLSECELSENSPYTYHSNESNSNKSSDNDKSPNFFPSL